MRIGIGYDVHKLVFGRDLILGGEKIPFEKGLLGHSDADVLIHAVMDSILGALAMRDIGFHFPDTDDAYKGIDSKLLLKKVDNIMKEKGYCIVNIDSVIMAQKPKLQNYIDKMRENISDILNIDKNQISIKATTTEKLGFIGREEGISVEAVCLLEKI